MSAIIKLKRYLVIMLVIALCFSIIECNKKAETYEQEGFVLITDVIPDAILEIRYYSTFNFVGERINAYEATVAYLTKEAAAALKNGGTSRWKASPTPKLTLISR